MNHLAEQVDILLEIFEDLVDQQAFGTIASLAVVNRGHQETLQPFLVRLKRKVVLNLADYRWLPKERYSEIQIIECSYQSGLPAFPCNMRHDSASKNLKEGLRPWLITFYGRPHPYLATFRIQYFPGVEVLRVVEGLGMIELQRIESPYSQYGNTLVSHDLARAVWGIGEGQSSGNIAEGARSSCDLRYQCHQDFQKGLQAHCPGQIWSKLDLVTDHGNRMEATVSRVSQETRGANFTHDILREHPRQHFCIPSGCKFRSIRFDMYVQLLPCMETIPDSEYEYLRNMAESRAKAHLDLTDKAASLVVQVFVLGAQESWRSLQDLAPVFHVSLSRKLMEGKL